MWSSSTPANAERRPVAIVPHLVVVCFGERSPRDRSQLGEGGSWRQAMRLVPLCGQCARWQTTGRPGRFTNAGHRDKTYDLAEISSTCVPTAWPRSVRRVCPQLVGDQFFLFAYSLSEIDPCFCSASLMPSSCLLHICYVMHLHRDTHVLLHDESVATAFAGVS